MINTIFLITSINYLECDFMVKKKKTKVKSSRKKPRQSFYSIEKPKFSLSFGLGEKGQRDLRLQSAPIQNPVEPRKEILQEPIWPINPALNKGTKAGVTKNPVLSTEIPVIKKPVFTNTHAINQPINQPSISNNIAPKNNMAPNVSFQRLQGSTEQKPAEQRREYVIEPIKPLNIDKRTLDSISTNLSGSQTSQSYKSSGLFLDAEPPKIKKSHASNIIFEFFFWGGLLLIGLRALKRPALTLIILNVFTHTTAPKPLNIS